MIAHKAGGDDLPPGLQHVLAAGADPSMRDGRARRARSDRPRRHLFNRPRRASMDSSVCPMGGDGTSLRERPGRSSPQSPANRSLKRPLMPMRRSSAASSNAGCRSMRTISGSRQRHLLSAPHWSPATTTSDESLVCGRSTGQLEINSRPGVPPWNAGFFAPAT